MVTSCSNGATLGASAGATRTSHIRSVHPETQLLLRPNRFRGKARTRILRVPARRWPHQLSTVPSSTTCAGQFAGVPHAVR